MALNKNGGIAPVATFKKFYEDAAREFSSDYSKLGISFEGWMVYMTKNILIKIHPSEMVEITVKGKDFLKYLLHWGRSEDSKRL